MMKRARVVPLMAAGALLLGPALPLAGGGSGAAGAGGTGGGSGSSAGARHRKRKCARAAFGAFGVKSGDQLSVEIAVKPMK